MSRYRLSTPRSTAPTRSGKENTARTPRASAAGAKAGHWPKASARSGSSTGPSEWLASMHGPSPRLNWRSSTSPQIGSETATAPRCCPSPITATPAPVTDNTSTQAPMSRSSTGGPPTSARRSVTRFSRSGSMAQRAIAPEAREPRPPTSAVSAACMFPYLRPWRSRGVVSGRDGVLIAFASLRGGRLFPSCFAGRPIEYYLRTGCARGRCVPQTLVAWTHRPQSGGYWVSIASEQRDGGRACEDSTWSVADRRVFDLTAASDSDDGWPRPIVAMNVGLAVADDPTLDAAQIVHEADKEIGRAHV